MSALAELHVSVEDWPALMVAGDADRLSVGADGAVLPLTSERSSTVSVPWLNIRWKGIIFVIPLGTVNDTENCFHTPPEDGTSASQ